MQIKEFEIGDIIRRRSNVFEKQSKLYYILQGRRHLKGKAKEFIAFRIAKEKTPGTWIIKQDHAIRVLGCKAAEIFNNDRDLLRYLKIYDQEKN